MFSFLSFRGWIYKHKQRFEYSDTCARGRAFAVMMMRLMGHPSPSALWVSSSSRGLAPRLGPSFPCRPPIFTQSKTQIGVMYDIDLCEVLWKRANVSYVLHFNSVSADPATNSRRLEGVELLLLSEMSLSACNECFLVSLSVFINFARHRTQRKCHLLNNDSFV